MMAASDSGYLDQVTARSQEVVEASAEILRRCSQISGAVGDFEKRLKAIEQTDYAAILTSGKEKA